MHKIFGYLLICAGVLFIFFAFIGMYKVFANGNPVVPVVQLADVQLSTQYGPIQIPMKSISHLANLGLFAVLMLFILSAGSKLAGIGNGMLKNERIYDALLQAKQENLQNPDSFKKL